MSAVSAGSAGRVLDDLRIEGWRTAAGHFESYTYPPGPPGRDALHVHEDVQLCLSLNFPGRYRSGGWRRDVPAGALSVVDAWEPHGAEDPCARTTAARYWMLYVARADWDRVAASIGASPRLGIHVTDDADVTRAFAALHRRSRSGATALEHDERLVALLSRLLNRGAATDAREPARADATTRARDFVHAHAIRGVALAEVARVVGASPQHLSACFRARFGVPLHRFQTLVRLDRARRLLAGGMPAGEAAAACGLADQSHLTRHFRRYLGTTPGRYSSRRRRAPAACDAAEAPSVGEPQAHAESLSGD